MEEIKTKIRTIKYNRLINQYRKIGEQLAVSIRNSDWDNALILRNEYRRIERLIKDINDGKYNR